MGRSAHHLINDAERIHDVEREQRDVRGLEHVAAGVEYEVRRFGWCRGRCRFLAEPLQHRVIELQAGQHGDVPADLAEACDALAPPLRQFMVGFGKGDARHRQQKARIDAVVAGLDTLAAEHAGGGPFARHFRPLAGAHDVEDAADDVAGADIRDPGRRDTGADLDAFAAARAGVEHVVHAAIQRRLEGDLAHRQELRRLDPI